MTRTAARQRPAHQDAAGGSLPTSGAAGPCGGAFGLELIYNKHDHQVTIYATIAPSTPATLDDVIARSEPPTVPADPAGLAHSPQHTRM